jgi:ATP-dependent RNA helicase RhlE
VLVATDIAARGIDVEALGHVVNFDVPNVPDDYIHRVGRTARAELTGEAFTFVSPDEEPELKAIEKAINRRLSRVTLPDFDYKASAPPPPAETRQQRPPQRGRWSGGSGRPAGGSGRPAGGGAGRRPGGSAGRRTR